MAFWPSLLPCSRIPGGHASRIILNKARIFHSRQFPPSPTVRHQSPDWKVFLASWDLLHAQGHSPYTVAHQFKVSCERPGGRRGPGSEWVGLLDRMGSAHIPICLQLALSCTFLQGSLFVWVGWGSIWILCIVGWIFCLYDYILSLSRCPSRGISHSGFNPRFSWHWWDSNPRSCPIWPDTLPTELSRHIHTYLYTHPPS